MVGKCQISTSCCFQNLDYTHSIFARIVQADLEHVSTRAHVFMLFGAQGCASKMTISLPFVTLFEEFAGSRIKNNGFRRSLTFPPTLKTITEKHVGCSQTNFDRSKNSE